MTRWNRCTITCGCDRNPSYYADCACKGGCERGSADRLQMLHYALAVTVAMSPSGILTCPLTGLPFAIADSEIDRVDATRGYEPGNVVLVSLQGNAGRAILQARGQDLRFASRYAQDVRIASNGIPVMRKRDLTPLPKRRRDSLTSGQDALALVTAGPYA